MAGSEASRTICSFCLPEMFIQKISTKNIQIIPWTAAAYCWGGFQSFRTRHSESLHPKGSSLKCDISKTFLNLICWKIPIFSPFFRPLIWSDIAEIQILTTINDTRLGFQKTGSYFISTSHYLFKIHVFVLPLKIHINIQTNWTSLLKSIVKFCCSLSSWKTSVEGRPMLTLLTAWVI